MKSSRITTPFAPVSTAAAELEAVRRAASTWSKTSWPKCDLGPVTKAMEAACTAPVICIVFPPYSDNLTLVWLLAMSCVGSLKSNEGMKTSSYFSTFLMFIYFIRLRTCWQRLSFESLGSLLIWLMGMTMSCLRVSISGIMVMFLSRKNMMFWGSFMLTFSLRYS